MEIANQHLANEIDPKLYAKLMQRAKSIPRVLTNPGSYQPKELEMPIVGNFTD